MRALLARLTVLGVLVTAGALSVGLAGVLAWDDLTLQHRMAAQAIATTGPGVAAAAQDLDTRLRSVMPLVTRTADQLSSGQLTAPGLPAWFHAELTGHALLSGFGVAYEPYAEAPGTRLYAPYLERQGRSFQLTDIATWYDYTQFQYRWYGDPILEGAMWKAPLFPLHSARPVAMYCVPFYKPGPRTPDEEPAGLVFATVSLRTLVGSLRGLRAGTSGYSFIFSRQGVYLSHPRADLVRDRQTVFETAWRRNDTALNSMAIRAIKGEHGYVGSHDELTGQSSWIFYAPVPTTGWTLAAVVFQDDFQPSADHQRHQLFAVVFLAVLGIVLMVAAPLLVRYEAPAVVWSVVAAVSLLLAAGIGTLWWISYRYPTQLRDARVKVFDTSATDAFLRRLGGPAGGAAPLIRIPTGVYVKSIEFQSSSDVTVSGYVWQKYLKGVDDGVPRGFVMPEAENPVIQQVSDRTDGNREVIDSHFTAVFRQEFSYRDYPLDRQAVWVRLRPAGFDQHVVLVPDFASYQIMNPRASPGVAGDLILPGWTVTGSNFDYRVQRYDTSFGIPGFDGPAGRPELYFDVDIRRDFLGPFISNIVPLIVTASMLFALLLTGTEEERRSMLSGFTALDVVLGTAALFFVVSFQHIALRNRLASPGLMYFEYFYFITYLALMLVSINAILFASSQRPRLIHFRDNLLPKVLYWPLYTGLLFLATLVVLS